MTVAPLATLRQRQSEKWQTFPDDVLPMFVAEMDYDLAPAVSETLLDAVRRSDTGYPTPSLALGNAYAGFAARRWGWDVDPAQVTAVGDVSAGVTETLRLFTRPGDPIVINPPVYPPFFDWVPEAGGRLLEVPLRSGRLDLAATEAAFARHPAAYLLCNPQNPVGRVHTYDELAAVVRLARLYRVPIVSDEIHAPLVLPGATFTPLLSVPGAAEVAVAVLSASKAFNLAGLKCAMVVTASQRMATAVQRFPFHPNDRLGHFGVLATLAALTEGDDWLDALLATLDARRTQLAGLLRERLPEVRWTPPSATYLAWLDCSAYGEDAAPRERFLTEARVAVEPGTRFGAAGAGYVRLNFATSPEILDEAVNRLSRVRVPA
ncbi:aminotransferase class I/II-fold pyridoxal phosphate-dependent enzyme [Actinoplanes sp. TBRC 11911]|nr:aminotransferase class I/II-fold pyridoxal phosphate-dependent enzyme [Actinoplanes sp. TBRC 11911]